MRIIKSRRGQSRTGPAICGTRPVRPVEALAEGLHQAIRRRGVVHQANLILDVIEDQFSDSAIARAELSRRPYQGLGPEPEGIERLLRLAPIVVADDQRHAAEDEANDLHAVPDGELQLALDPAPFAKAECASVPPDRAVRIA